MIVLYSGGIEFTTVRINKSILYILLWWSATMPCSIHAQYLFTHLGIKEGLSSKEVKCIIEDKQGFIWMGTPNGLNRFDGSSVKVYNHLNGNYPTELNETVLEILEYDDGVFLLGTDNGLVCFDYYNQQFSSVSFERTHYSNKKLFRVYYLMKDPLDRIWIITSQGWFVMVKGRILSVSDLFPSLNEFKDQLVNHSLPKFDKKREGIWMGTTEGMKFLSYKNRILYSHKNNPDSLPFLEPHGVFYFALDEESGDMWLSDTYFPLRHFSAKTKRTSKVDYRDFNPRSFTPLHIYTDAANRLWVSSWQRALYVIEPDSTILKFPEQSKEPYPIRNGFVYDMMETSNNDLWLATAGGAYKMSTNSPVTKIIELTGGDNFIYSFLLTPDSQIVAATNEGLFIHDQRTNKTQQFLVNRDLPSANRLFQIVEINQEWWCGTGEGIQIFNPQTQTFRSVPKFAYADEVNTRGTMEIIQDSRGYVWFSSWASFIYRLDLLTMECIRFDGKNPFQGDIGATNCLTMEEASNGNVWFANNDKGIRIFDYGRNTFYNPIRDSLLNISMIDQMVEDPEHNMWVSTWGNGIYKLNLNGQILERFTTKDGLTSNWTNSMNLDPYDKIWFATHEALHYFQPKTSKPVTIRLDNENSLTESWIHLAFDKRYCYASVIGDILRIDQERINQESALLPPLITGINAFDQEIPFAPWLEAIELKHNQDFFRIDYSSHEHLENASLQYEYKLENFNDDWVNNARHLSVSFTNVPHGDYIFRIRATDINGTLVSQPTSFAIEISPPFWNTSWFYTLCFLAASVLAYQFYRFQSRRKEKKKAEQIIDYFANSVYGENAVNEICWDIARNCISQLGFKECSVYLADNEKKILMEKASFGSKNPKGHEIQNPIEIPYGSGLIGHTVLTATPVLIGDISKHNTHSGQINHHSLISVPIIHDQKVVGVISAEDQEKDFFTENHLKTLMMIASISALKIADANAEIVSQENELKLLEVNKLFTESQLKALRAQMNPHFVFNCLNSIQECIFTKKFAEASAYLNKFAKLFRMVLNNSGKMLIPVEDEIEVLKLYLELESMRFDHSFTYSIDLDPDLEEDVLVPSMFLQPFVENAIWHGLMHKPEDRQLKISFTKISEEIFECVVEDNGIGRAKSLELKKAKGVSHKYESKGMKMTEERLEILRKQNYHASLSIEDKNGHNGNDTGTRVVVELSTDLNNF